MSPGPEAAEGQSVSERMDEGMVITVLQRDACTLGPLTSPLAVWTMKTRWQMAGLKPFLQTDLLYLNVS